MSLVVGTVVEMTRDAPEYNVFKGDVGVIKGYGSKEYLVEIYDKEISIYLPNGYIKEYHYKYGDRVEIISPTSKYKGYFATIYSERYGCCNNYVNLFVDNTNYKPSFDHNRYLTLVKTSVRPINVNNKKGDDNMKLTGFNKVAVIECNSNLDLHYALYDDDIKVGDYVLVTGKLCSQIKQIKNIITIDEARESYKDNIIAEVKCKVDLSAYDQRVKNRIEAEKLRQKMDEEIKKMDELNKYEMYADRNPVLKEMLEQLKKLNGN